MYCALNGIVAPSCQEIARVDDNGVGYGSGIDEMACRAPDLKTTPVILE